MRIVWLIGALALGGAATFQSPTPARAEDPVWTKPAARSARAVRPARIYGPRRRQVRYVRARGGSFVRNRALFCIRYPILC